MPWRADRLSDAWFDLCAAPSLRRWCRGTLRVWSNKDGWARYDPSLPSPAPTRGAPTASGNCRRKDDNENRFKRFPRAAKATRSSSRNGRRASTRSTGRRSSTKNLLQEHVAQLSPLQELLYADNRYALLLIFQAMDAAGKDGAIKHVMSGVNPQGCQVFSFKQPSAEELEHDFLWRTTCRLPERGRIGIFNRSYYEEVLIARVHPEILRSEGLPEEPPTTRTSGTSGTAPSWIWSSISTATARGSSNSSCICRRRSSAGAFSPASMSRPRTGSSAWPTSPSGVLGGLHEGLRGVPERDEHAATRPWYVVPADDKENARLIISQIILDTLQGLKMGYPKTSAARRKELLAIRKQLERGH